MSETTLGDEHRLPYERGSDSQNPVDSLFDALGSDPEFADEEQPEPDEPEAEDDAAESEEDDDSDEFDDEEEADDGDEEPDEQLRYRVKVDGEEVEVPLDELIAGYSRTSDYTRKTQALAEQRKQIEQETAQYREVRDRYAQSLDVLKQAIEATQPAEPDWDRLRKEDPAEFAAQWAEHTQRKQELDAVTAEQQRVQAEQAREQQEALRTHLAQESQKLHEAMGWEDEAKASEHKKQLMSYATDSFGFTAEELGQVYDHRLLVMLDKARRYDELQATGKEAVRKKAANAPVLKPGGRQAPTKGKSKRTKIKRAKEALARTGSARDAAAAIAMYEDLD